MIIDEIKKANMLALKEKDTNARAIYSIIISKNLQATIEARTTGKEVGDAELVKMIQKTIKELGEEADNYKKVNNVEQEENVRNQAKLLEKYLPNLLSEDEIRKIINSLEDRSVPSVMRHFKTNYNGQCDMGEVSKVLKTL